MHEKSLKMGDETSPIIGERRAAAIAALKQHTSEKTNLLSLLCKVENVCPKCLLCIAGVKAPSLYETPPDVLWSAMNTFVQADGCDEPSHQEKTLSTSCATCFGILQIPVEEFTKTVRLKILERGYELDSVKAIMLSLSLPSSLIIRQHCLSAHLTEQLKESGSTDAFKMLEMKEAFRWIYSEHLLQDLGATLEQTSGDDGAGRLKIGAEYKHEESSSEKEVLLAGVKHRREVRGRRERGQRRGEMQEIENVNAVVAELGKLKPGEIRALYSWPLPLPKTQPELTVKIERESTFVGGAYCKYSRAVSQSPWNEAHGDIGDSVQTLILRSLGPLFGATETKFIGSGREDVDVRMLGGGRPFLLEFIDAKRLPVAPHFTQVGEEACSAQTELYKSIEEAVNKSTDLVQVHRLRAEGRRFGDLIKGSAETKRKTYKALVWTAAPIQPEAVEALKDVKDLVIHQSTPIRVLHRRSVAVRQRTIHELRIELVNRRFLLLTLQTEAGTYVKEFVHGDLGRTQPSLGSLLGCEADILQLDVMHVEL